MRLPFLEVLEREQRLALVTAIVRRMGELDLLAQAAADREPVEVAHEIVGTTDMDRAERWAVVNATIAIGTKALDAAAIVSEELLVPTLTNLAESTGRVAHRLSRRRSLGYVRTTGRALTSSPEQEVEPID